MDWNKILNWKLLVGSHEFPGLDGGTCINEAAIVAAGFKYKPVLSAKDCPPCFSLVLSAYAIFLNDRLPGDERQELMMPFVTRLAGTADTPKVERQRFDFIILGLIRTVLPISLRGGKNDLAAECERVTSYDEAVTVVNKLYNVARTRSLPCDLARSLSFAHACSLPCDLDLDLPHVPAYDLAFALFLPFPRARAINQATVALLDGAMQIGKQAEPAEAAIVVNRLAKVRQPMVMELT